MAEFDSGSLYVVSTKLNNLLTQVHAASSEDLSNKDVKAALSLMKANLADLISDVKDAVDYSPSLREGIILAASEHIYLYSAVLGTIIRSSTTRNPFELYFPFKQIAKKFFPDGAVYLILSSEWNYIPFTYPLTLDELPNFILIGMPAPEADNVLAFPLAGHELGHSIWRRKELVSKFSASALDLAKKRFQENPELLKALYPNLTKEQFENDMFSSILKDSVISDIIALCVKQTEEVFCDLVGASIFGTSYLHAFRYLLAPTARGERSYKYPDLAERADLLDKFAADTQMPAVNISRWFNKQDDISHPFYAQLVRVADGIRREMWELTKSAVRDVVSDAQIKSVRDDRVQLVKGRFLQNMPIEGDVSLGELICGAWAIYENKFDEGLLGESGRIESAISNLVLKSAEAIEFKLRMTVASHQ